MTRFTTAASTALIAATMAVSVAAPASAEDHLLDQNEKLTKIFAAQRAEADVQRPAFRDQVGDSRFFLSDPFSRLHLKAVNPATVERGGAGFAQPGVNRFLRPGSDR